MDLETQLEALNREVATKFRVGFYVQGDYVGFNTGNEEKLSCNQAELGQASCLAVAEFLSISSVKSYVDTLYIAPGTAY